MPAPRTAAVLAAASLAATLTVTLAACAPRDSSSAPGSASTKAITVDSTATACALSTSTAPSGTVTFRITNSGSEATEFYLFAADGLRILAEVENIGPGTARTLVLTAKAGSYQTACKPGMVGTGLRAPFTVTDSGAAVEPTGARADQIAAATASYVAYVKDQTEQLLAATKEFSTAYLAGDDAAARAAYAPARTHWERVEPVAESFGDLDPRMDLREADVEAGAAWTGWHLLEKDLWPPAAGADGTVAYVPLTAAQRTQFAGQLVADTTELDARVHDDGFALTVDQIGNGAKSLLDEVASGKVTGEEEAWSHTDLWDFQANVDGAKVGYAGLRDVVAASDAELAEALDARFADVQRLLDTHRAGDGFVLYTALSQEEIKELSTAVDALAEPLSRLTAAVVDPAAQ